MQESLEAPTLDADVHPDEPYVIMGYSCSGISSASPGLLGKRPAPGAPEDFASEVYGRSDSTDFQRSLLVYNLMGMTHLSLLHIPG